MNNSTANRRALAILCLLAIVALSCVDDGANNVGNVDIADVFTKDCYEPSNDDDEWFDTVALSWDGQTLAVNHTNTCRNCAFDMRVYAVARGSLLTIVEWSPDGDLVARCSCMFDYAYQLEGLEPGVYDFKFYYKDFGDGPYLKFERQGMALEETPWEDILVGRDTSQCR